MDLTSCVWQQLMLRHDMQNPRMTARKWIFILRTVFWFWFLLFYSSVIHYEIKLCRKEKKPRKPLLLKLPFLASSQGVSSWSWHLCWRLGCPSSDVWPSLAWYSTYNVINSLQFPMDKCILSSRAPVTCLQPQQRPGVIWDQAANLGRALSSLCWDV